MRILFIGDVVAKPGRETVKEVLPKLKKEENIDFETSFLDKMPLFAELIFLQEATIYSGTMVLRMKLKDYH